MRDVRRGLWLIAIGISMLLFATYIHAQQIHAPEPEDSVKGCWMHGWDTVHNSPVFDFFVKISDKDSDGEEGNEIWGYRPDDPPKKDKDGYYKWLNIPERRFVKVNSFKNLNGHPCRCPPW